MRHDIAPLCRLPVAPPGAFPGIQPEVMMIPPGRKKSRLLSHALGHLKSQHIAPERQGPLQIGHLEMHMADPHAGMNRGIFHPAG